MRRQFRMLTTRLRREEGFTLLEALATLTLTGLILLSLLTVTGQWLPQWRFGFAQAQRLDMLEVGLHRIVADLDAAEFITADSQIRTVLFIGDATSVMLVRVAASPDVAPRLEFVRLAPDRDARGAALFRTRAPFAPLTPGRRIADQVRFSDPVALVRAPVSVFFAYAGPNRVWRENWNDSVAPPTAIRIQARDLKSGATLASTTTRPLVDAPAVCVGRVSIPECLKALEASPPTTSVGSDTGDSPPE